MRAAFWLPDISVPAGGMSVAYRCAGYLSQRGYRVSLLHSRARFCYPFEDRGGVPVESFSAFRRRRAVSTVLVVPEIFAGTPALQAMANPVIVLHQNPFLTGGDEVDWLYRSERLLGVVAASAYTAAYLSLRYPAVPIARMTCGIDVELFRPAASSGRHRRLSWMPRKRHADAELVLATLGPELASSGWSVHAIDGVDQRHVARALGDTDLFLSFAEREGFGLPLAEAMAAGAACVGFTGAGGEELLTDRTGWPVPDPDVVAFVKTVRHVRQLIDEGDAVVARKTQAAREHVVNGYSRRRERESVLTAFGELLGQLD